MDFEIKDGIYLSFVEARNVHCDNLSFEEKTGILKRKYKLFHRRLGGGVYCFSVFSKTKTVEHNISALYMMILIA
ncbi:MAG: hypothetical protein MNSN_08870 [Minisyncoccus archaeiphilus]|jgi:hypothetical protein|uniref:hypothetical protein n=1 Tax=Minisyncoccus archaeiphilus TaxID=3238481 RepID=UPI0009CA72A3|nr:MAG: hypothetical protein BWY21_00838 [Parcubacteria group bacterium ADurb.Bin216]GMX59873.1 MAG: hypothetical protein MNSN_08870 [Candidatus Parcubacteria bacterium]